MPVALTRLCVHYGFTRLTKTLDLTLRNHRQNQQQQWRNRRQSYRSDEEERRDRYMPVWRYVEM